jgi:translation initiation factor IF-1
MCDPDGFEASGIVVKAVANGRFLIEMPNGHQAFGVVQKKNKI